MLIAKAEGSTNIWIIIDGPGVGVQVFNGPEGDGKIFHTPFDQVGNINLPDSNCPGDKSHYNGTLYGQPDPGGCGWGRVVRYSDALIELQLITDILMDEEFVRLELQREDANVDSMKSLLSSAKESNKQLLSLLASKAAAGKISRRTYNKLKASLKSVSVLDAKVDPESSTEKEREQDIKDLSAAYDIKTRIVKQIVSLEQVLR